MFRVDMQKLAWTIEDMTAFEAELDRELAEVDAIVARLQGVWNGDAADAQSAAHRRWSAGAAKMRVAVEEMRRAAALAEGNYNASADANVGMWGSIG